MPAPHSTQTLAPALEYRPTLQAMQLVEATAPTVVETSPATQSEHTAVPVESAKVPILQLRQLAEP